MGNGIVIICFSISLSQLGSEIALSSSSLMKPSSSTSPSSLEVDVLNESPLFVNYCMNHQPKIEPALEVSQIGQQIQTWEEKTQIWKIRL